MERGDLEPGDPPPPLPKGAGSTSGSWAFQNRSWGNSANPPWKLHPLHLKAERRHEEALSAAPHTCPSLSSVAFLHRRFRALAPSCCARSPGARSASVSLFTRLGFFAFLAAPTNTLFILAQACPRDCVWILLVSLALRPPGGTRLGCQQVCSLTTFSINAPESLQTHRTRANRPRGGQGSWQSCFQACVGKGSLILFCLLLLLTAITVMIYAKFSPIEGMRGVLVCTSISFFEKWILSTTDSEARHGNS